MATKKRLIDANVLGRDSFHIMCEGEDGEVVERCVVDWDDIETAPTVDAVEVVRCKDCKWYEIAPIDNVPYCCHESGYCGEYMPGLFYCANGERKDNGED